MNTPQEATIHSAISIEECNNIEEGLECLDGIFNSIENNYVNNNNNNNNAGVAHSFDDDGSSSTTSLINLCNLTKTCPGAFLKWTGAISGSTALHEICRHNVSIEVVEAVHRAFPGAVYKKNRCHHLPIHVACIGRASLKVVRFLVGKYKESLGIINLLKYTPLHYACDGATRPIKLGVVAYLLENCPKAAAKKNSFGRTPLSVLLYHFCHFKGAIDEEAVQLLLQAAPGVASARDKSNDRPIDYVMGPKRCVDIPVKILELLLDYTKKVSLMDIWNSNANWTVRFQALSYYQRRLRNKNDNYVGGTGTSSNDEKSVLLHPLHSILRCALLQPRHYEESVDRCEQYIGDIDGDGRFPLHLALTSSSIVPAKTILKIMRAKPCALIIPDPIDNDVPFVAASLSVQWRRSSTRREVLDVIYYALRKDPVAIISSFVEFPI